MILLIQGCAISQQAKDKWAETGSLVAKKAASIVLQTVINSAVNSFDRSSKVDFVQGLSEGLRSQQGNMLTSSDLKEVIRIWTPDKPHWQEMGDQIADLYGKQAPTNSKEAAETLERIAKGLDTIK